MSQQDATGIARLMLRRHGLQARAVASERMQELRLAGDAAGLDRWQHVLATIEDRRYGAAGRTTTSTRQPH
jgi:hypothetical protein